MSLDYKKLNLYIFHNSKCIGIDILCTRERERAKDIESVREEIEKYRARKKKQFQVIGKQIPEFEN